MRAGAKASLASALILLLSGCTSVDSGAPATSSAPPPAPPPAPTVEYGSIEGTVVDEEAVPLVSVTAALIEANVKAQSDEAGRFVINDITEGKHKLFLEKLGYESVAKLVEVKVGEVTPVTFTMRSLSTIPENIIDIVPYDGFIQCSINVYYAMNPCEPVAGANRDRFLFELRNATLKEAMFEMDWTPASGATGQKMELDVCLPQPDPVQGKLLCYGTPYNKWTSGPPPRSLRVSDMPWKTNKQFVTGAGAGYQSGDVLYQQPFTIWVSTCYYEECPEEHTAMPPK